jgi:D-alanyl-lipoteichoic acid acyltransferase DltB (MBOAT superfamily)
MYKLRLVLYAIFWSGVILLLPKEEMLYKLFITIGGCIFLFAMNSMSITRIAWYFLIAILVALPVAMRSLKKRDIKKIAMIAVMAAMVFLFSYDVIRDSNTHGCSPYDSIFSTNYANQKFRPKSY